MTEDYLTYGHRIEHYIADTPRLTWKHLDEGGDVIFEGAQGTLLDIDHGTYPYVPSSNSTAGGAATGLGVGPGAIGTVLGVAKAYTTRVGGGPLPSELFGEMGERLELQHRSACASAWLARAALTLAVFVMAPAAWAADDKAKKADRNQGSASPGSKAPERWSGEVVSVDPDAGTMTVRMSDGTTQAFRGDKETLKDYKPGDRISGKLRAQPSR